MQLDTFYESVKVFLDRNHFLGKRIIPLLEDVILRLPNEEQFRMKGQINFNTREQAIEFWKSVHHIIGFSPDLRPFNRDGNCTYNIAETIADSRFVITIIVENLAERSDDYIKGLIAHELSEMSYVWRITQSELPNLKKMKSKARQIKINQITKHNSIVGSQEYIEHENAVNEEARRLGFEKEINILEQ